MVNRDKTHPSKSYMPWLRWLITLAATMLLPIALKPGLPGVVRIAAVCVAVFLLLTYRPIHQKFVLADERSTVVMRASAGLFGNVTVRLASNGETRVLKLGKIGRPTTQKQFEESFGDVTRSFSLGHLANTRYFLLGENTSPGVPRAVIQENSLCF